MGKQLRLAAVAVAVLATGVVVDRGGAAPAGSRPSPPVVAAAPSAVAPGAPADAASELLLPADSGDGDSWRDTAGREYRLGLVNTPEHDECFGAQATAERRARTADGFRADVYTTDRYGRAVAVVTTADGLDLNVHLAREGFADDRFLAEFRSEHEDLARRLDAAFAAARREGKGLWSACRDTGVPSDVAPAAAPATAGCHRDYSTCVPVRGDGSGLGGANDLDCGDVTGAVRLRSPGVDPYRFDADGDGTGCDS